MLKLPCLGDKFIQRQQSPAILSYVDDRATDVLYLVGPHEVREAEPAKPWSQILFLINQLVFKLLRIAVRQRQEALCVRPCALTPPSGLDTVQIVEQRAHEIVV